MLAKPLKYDFKAMFKIFLPLWGVLLVVSGVNRLLSGSPLAEGGGMGIFTSLLGVMYVLLIMAVMVVTTVIIIAQRITSVMDADMIVILDDGKVHAVGTHKELLANDTIYQEIYASQMKGDDADGKGIQR